jgi:phenylacetic acid degradation operon negative regulatory protein
MKAKSELMLYHLFWLADYAMRPSIRRVGESFEEWAYKNGYLRQIQTLERQGMLESTPAEKGARRVVKLTREGMLRALGGMDPVERWDRPWDGQWRMALFDLPEEKRSLRNALRNELKAARFGCLQGSVWISPDPVDRLRENFRKSDAAIRTIVFFEGRPCDGADDAEMVRAAWDFESIKQAYREHQACLEDLPRTDTATRNQLLDWGNRERDAWARCLKLDPLLPRALWPSGYPAETSWRERLDALKKAGEIASRL